MRARGMMRRAMVLLTACVSGCAIAQDTGVPIPPDLLTAAEKSDFKATARHEEVVALVDALDAASDLARRVDFGATHEGRVLPALVVADPPVTTPAEAADAARSGRLVALLYANIHAGEVDGKEAFPMLARELILTPDHPLLDRFVVIIAPIYNADGNERVSKDNRPGQVGPDEGMGVRENAMGLDLNRDFMKLDAPETRALVRFVNDWNPHVVVDAHTTNGSFHRYPLTYAGPKSLAGDPELLRLVRDRLLPEVSTRLVGERGLRTFFYGNFEGEKTRWESFPSQARYGTTYFGLANRVSILTEGYSYATYRERVMATLDFTREVLEWVGEHADDVRGAIDGARRRGTEAGANPEPDDLVAIRSRLVAAPERVTLLGWEEEVVDGRSVATDRPRDYEVEHWDRDEATLAVPRPFAYVIPPDRVDLVERLQRHAIRVDELREDLEIEAEAYTLDSVAIGERPYQNRRMATIEATPGMGVRRIPAGSWIVRAAQPLSNLAVCLLEPEGEDSFAAWGFFEGLEAGGTFPVLRLPARTPLLLVESPNLIDPPPTPERLTYDLLDRSDRRPNLNGSPLGGPRWIDPEHYLQSRDGRLRVVHAPTGRSEFFHDPDALASALASIPSIDERAARRFADQGFFTLTEDRTGVLFEHENDLYFARLDASSARRLTSTPEEEEFPQFSPDGRFVAFVRSNDLWVVDVETATERALTTGGTDLVRNAKADWVYFEEVFGRSWRTFWWSPDSTRLAFLQSDASGVPDFTIVDDRRRQGDAQVVERARYPKPGQANPVVRLGIVTTAGGPVRWCDTSRWGEHLITSVGWWPDSSRAFACVQDRAQRWLDFTAFSRDAGAPDVLFRETTEAWVDAPGSIEFLSDGSFIFPSERTGFRHLYRYERDGRLIGPLTSGEWAVRSVARAAEAQGWIYFSANRDNPIAENLYRVRLDASGLERLTHEPGTHRTSVSPEGRYFYDSWSSTTTPPRAVLRAPAEGGGGVSFVRHLDTNPVRDLDRFVLPPYELVELAAPDGHVLRAGVIKPPDFDPSRRYPVWLTTYSGPHAPVVGDDWGGGRLNDRLLATLGIVAVEADPRSASGVSARSAWHAYRRLGVTECQDLDAVVDHLAQFPWIDPSRVGISGHSYGGFMTAFAMTHSTKYCAGIAGAPVTDWRDYDSIYTERYMDTPQENPEGYSKTSVVEAAKDLHGRLLLLHGSIDDNVHAQNTMRLIDALQRADKDFEVMVYPGARHGIGGAHYSRLIHEFILRMLRPDAPESP